jgi:uncharacterized protein YqhQ
VLKRGVALGYTFTWMNITNLVKLLKELGLPEYMHEVLTITGIKEEKEHVQVENFKLEMEQKRLAQEKENERKLIETIVQ